jgi:hypothetical protein
LRASWLELAAERSPKLVRLALPIELPGPRLSAKVRALIDFPARENRRELRAWLWREDCIADTQTPSLQLFASEMP